MNDESTPRWVYVFGIISIAVVVLALVLHLLGAGPWMHGL